MSGISTNFGVWHFTHYKKKEEMLGRPAFQVTEAFDVMDMARDEINMCELKRLCVCLNWMTFIEREKENGTPGKADFSSAIQPY
jgi:hypothetical protein